MDFMAQRREKEREKNQRIWKVTQVLVDKFIASKGGSLIMNLNECIKDLEEEGFIECK